MTMKICLFVIIIILLHGETTAGVIGRSGASCLPLLGSLTCTGGYIAFAPPHCPKQSILIVSRDRAILDVIQCRNFRKIEFPAGCPLVLSAGPGVDISPQNCMLEKVSCVLRAVFLKT